MAETKAHDHPEPNYFGIIIVLTLLTMAEVGAVLAKFEWGFQ